MKKIAILLLLAMSTSIIQGHEERTIEIIPEEFSDLKSTIDDLKTKINNLTESILSEQDLDVAKKKISKLLGYLSNSLIRDLQTKKEYLLHAFGKIQKEQSLKKEEKRHEEERLRTREWERAITERKEESEQPLL